MPDAVTGAFQTPGLWFLAFGAFMAGIVRGFTGFGTAMVYLPVAAQVLSPFEALTTMLVKDLTGPLIHVPRALKDGHPADVVRLGVGALIGLPFGVWVLSQVPPEVFRWAVSLIALTLLVLLCPTGKCCSLAPATAPRHLACSTKLARWKRASWLI